MIATQRRASMRSPSSGTLSSAMMIGTEKKIDEVTVSCRYCSAVKLIAVIDTISRPRTTCSRMRLLRASARPWIGSSSAADSSACETKRIHTTSITGTARISHFALPSSSVKKT